MILDVQGLKVTEKKKMQKKFLFICGMTITALFLFCFVRALVTADASNDLTVYQEAARAVRNGENPYLGGRTTHYEGVGDVTWRYLYPPLLAVLLSCVEDLGEWWLITCWSALTTCSLMVVGWMVSRLFNRRETLAPLMIVAITLWPVTLDGVERGQINTWILAILFIWFAAIQNRNFVLAGVVVAVGVHLKLTPLLLALPFLCPGTGKFWFSFFVTLTSLAGVIALAGNNLWTFYLEKLSSLGSGSSGWISPENLSLSKLLVGVFSNIPQHIGVQIQYVLVGMLSLFTVVRGHVNGTLLTPPSLSRIVLLFILASPLLWYHHMVWVLLPLSILLTRGRNFVFHVVLLSLGVGVSSYRLVESLFIPSNGWSANLILVEPALWNTFVLILWWAASPKVAVNDFEPKTN